MVIMFYFNSLHLRVSCKCFLYFQMSFFTPERHSHVTNRRSSICQIRVLSCIINRNDFEFGRLHVLDLNTKLCTWALCLKHMTLLRLLTLWSPTFSSNNVAHLLRHSVQGQGQREHYNQTVIYFYEHRVSC